MHNKTLSIYNQKEPFKDPKTFLTISVGGKIIPLEKYLEGCTINKIGSLWVHLLRHPVHNTLQYVTTLGICNMYQQECFFPSFKLLPG
jgi:hypothetical protein